MTPEGSDKRNFGGIAFRSKLLPFANQIARWQREGDGKSYREIARLLKEEHGLDVHPDTINAFVLVRARKRKRAVLPAEYLEGNPSPSPELSALPATVPAVTPKPAAEASLPSSPVTPKNRPRRGMLPPTDSKYLDERGQPVPPPPDPRAARPENL